MKVQTLTVPLAAPHLVLRLKMESALERLASIIEGIGSEMYKEYKDTLSFQLMEWSAQVMAIDLSDETLGQEMFKEEVQKNLEMLKTGILVDFIAKSTLKDPMLVVETGWTCEKQLLQWNQLDQTAYKGKPITLVPHAFAQQMLAWALSVTEETPTSSASSDTAITSSSTSNQLISTPSQTPQEANLESYMRSFLMTYKMQFQQKMAMFKLNQFIQDVYKESELLQSLLTLIDQRSKERMEKAQVQMEKDRKALEERMDNMQKAQAETVKHQQASNAEMRQQVEAAQAEVLKAKLKSLDQEAEMRSLRHAYACRLQEIQALHDSVSSDTGCVIL